MTQARAPRISAEQRQALVDQWHKRHLPDISAHIKGRSCVAAELLARLRANTIAY